MYGIQSSIFGPACTIQYVTIFQGATIFSNFSISHTFGLDSGSPNISKNTDFVNSSVFPIVSFLRSISSVSLSSFEMIIFCSSRDGSGISISERYSFEIWRKPAPLKPASIKSVREFRNRKIYFKSTFPSSVLSMKQSVEVLNGSLQ